MYNSDLTKLWNDVVGFLKITEPKLEVSRFFLASCQTTLSRWPIDFFFFCNCSIISILKASLFNSSNFFFHIRNPLLLYLTLLHLVHNQSHSLFCFSHNQYDLYFFFILVSFVFEDTMRLEIYFFKYFSWAFTC